VPPQPPVAAAPRPAPEPAPEARPATERQAAPAEDPSADPDKPATADIPLPPRRPASLLASLDAPLPPPRPAEFARLPDVITRGGTLGGTLGGPLGGTLRATLDETPVATLGGRAAHGADSVTLAYAGPSPRTERAAIPLPPPRPPLQPLRAAAQGKAEERAAKAATQMAPARVDRGALHALAAPAPELRSRPAVSGGVAPPLRAAAKHGVLAAHATAKGVETGFGAQATTLSPSGFSKKAD
jgi:hypothetical protein